MILYHGSYVEVKEPSLSFSRDNLDFGKGFYTTPIKEQAEKWAQRFKRRGKKGIISIYSIDESLLDTISVRIFESYSEEWIDFILNCRRGLDPTDYDVVIGGVANDKVFNTVELYYENLIDKTEAIKRLKYEKPNQQICFRNQMVMDRYLKFEGSEQL